MKSKSKIMWAVVSLKNRILANTVSVSRKNSILKTGVTATTLKKIGYRCKKVKVTIL